MGSPVSEDVGVFIVDVVRGHVTIDPLNHAFHPKISLGLLIFSVCGFSSMTNTSRELLCGCRPCTLAHAGTIS